MNQADKDRIWTTVYAGACVTHMPETAAARATDAVAHLDNIEAHKAKVAEEARTKRQAAERDAAMTAARTAADMGGIDDAVFDRRYQAWESLRAWGQSFVVDWNLLPPARRDAVDRGEDWSFAEPIPVVVATKPGIYIVWWAVAVHTAHLGLGGNVQTDRTRVAAFAVEADARRAAVGLGGERGPNGEVVAGLALTLDGLSGWTVPDLRRGWAPKWPWPEPPVRPWAKNERLLHTLTGPEREALLLPSAPALALEPVSTLWGVREASTLPAHAGPTVRELFVDEADARATSASAAPTNAEALPVTFLSHDGKTGWLAVEEKPFKIHRDVDAYLRERALAKLDTRNRAKLGLKEHLR